MLLTKLENQQDQWTMVIPISSGDFGGKPISLSVLKLHETDEPYEQTRLSQDEILLLESILQNLPSIVSTITNYFSTKITPNEPTFIDHAHEPMIWLSRQDRIDKGIDWWTFCVGRDDDPESHWYFDYRGLKLVDAYFVR